MSAIHPNQLISPQERDLALLFAFWARLDEQTKLALDLESALLLFGGRIILHPQESKPEVDTE